MWTAKYGSITFNQYGREMSSGGMNQAGLVAEAMALEATRYPNIDQRDYIGSSSQWRQYLLDTCATVAEVISSNTKIRISNKTSGPGIHLLVLAKIGGCATIEFLNSRMIVHTGQNLPVEVLTHNTYAESLQSLKDESIIKFYAYSSINQFITAAKRNQNCQARTAYELVTFAFGTLQAVASHRTQWRVVYDNMAMRIYFRTLNNHNIRYINYSGFDFSHDTPIKILDADADLSGNVTDKFSDYTYKANRDLIARSFRKTSFLSKIPKERLDALASFPERFFCP
jgi:choloylglycine hydrolase